MWIHYDDLMKNFLSIAVCKVKNWEEVRIKGKFLRVQDVEDANIELVIAKWYYSIEVT